MEEDAGFENWVQLCGSKVNVMTDADKPCLSAWCTYVVTDTSIETHRNHYYYGVDPEGNQLPYTDSAIIRAIEVVL